jgi:hypothetical protein
MKKLFFLIPILGIWLYQFPHYTISPGVLLQGHQNLNTKCISCHKPFGGIPIDRCIACHSLSEIGKKNIPTKNILFHTQVANQSCNTCHKEHNGLNSPLALIDFNHETVSKDILSKCLNCHKQPKDTLHQQVTSDCNSCHNTEGWKYYTFFNHKMITASKKANCIMCHQKPKDSLHNLTNTNCISCHNTNQWSPASFDHSQFFVLDENHNASCTTCHTNQNFSTYTCYGCHEHSESNLRGEHNEEGIFNLTNCISCHKSGSGHGEGDD